MARVATLRLYHHVETRPTTPEEVWAHWIGEWTDRIADDRDNIVVIDGPTAEGKSVLGYRIGRSLDPGFDRHRYVYSAEDMLALWGTVRPGATVVYDESVLGLLSRNFHSEENTLLVQAGMIARKLLVTVLLCIPDIMFLDVAYRSTLAKYRIIVERRGVAWVHVRSDRPRYDTSDKRRHYKSLDWNPLRWADAKGEAEWDFIYARSQERARRFAVEAATRLATQRQKEQGRPTPVQEILRLRSEGLSYDEIAERLRVSSHTIRRAVVRGAAAASPP
ncbi:MAG: helix-turn-helix domain-containing protein [Thermoplasmata archaeon]|nr:helix-turn-helix domain-containing protein [Thermoplasmata archaeon]